tara:strand:- start:2344 stop:2532 length:189 start_codon:yes stop_codon:yes gene_type:complete
MSKEFEQVLEFYKNSTPRQHQMFLDLISDKMTFFNIYTKECFDVDEEYVINFNGIFHQINIK